MLTLFEHVCHHAEAPLEDKGSLRATFQTAETKTID
jgi:hypothetical protein